ncbi:MAG: cytochrome ubiquinol oxidase subunit I [Acidimicrobiia bacterium]|nr:cytochrome ubiquinol oxidase subunit I [Acidimicrobiia bacterium]
MASGPASALAMLAGWTVTEVGRQPWIVYGVMRTEEAVTAAQGIDILYYVMIGMRTIITVATLSVLVRLARRPLPDHVLGEGPRSARARRDACRRRRRHGHGAGPVSLANAVAALLFAALSAYALLGGADFGVGFWDLVAGGAERGAKPRSFIERVVQGAGVGGQPPCG